MSVRHPQAPVIDDEPQMIMTEPGIGCRSVADDMLRIARQA
jgi:hypothetical protein